MLNKNEASIYDILQKGTLLATEDFIISIDMGGTKMLAAAVNPQKQIFARMKRATNVVSGKSDYADDIARLVEDMISEHGLNPENLKAVCLGIPGSVMIEEGIIGIAPNLGLKDYPVRDELKARLPYPVLIENDVNLAALGIRDWELPRHHRNILVVFLGTGIGGGLVLNGQIYRGATSIAGEIGHITYSTNGPVCGCGKKGCFEAVASRTAIVRHITADIKAGKKSVLKAKVDEGKMIKSKAIASALREKDKVTVNAVTSATKIAGKVLSDINNLLNLDLIVLGGGLIEAAGDFILPILRKSFEKYSLKDCLDAVELHVTELGDDAALYGGLSLVEEFTDYRWDRSEG